MPLCPPPKSTEILLNVVFLIIYYLNAKKKKNQPFQELKTKNLQKIHTGRKVTQPFDLEMAFFCTDISNISVKKTLLPFLVKWLC